MAASSTFTSRYAFSPSSEDSRRLRSYSPSVPDQETFLYQAVYVYLLKATDIRPADRSLFDRKDILAIHTLPCVSITFQPCP